jgi:hypothetical protein
MGGGMSGGGAGGGERPAMPEIMPNTDRETMILSLPEEWYASVPLSDDLKTDTYLFPTGQDHSDWTETLRQEAFRSTNGIGTAQRVYELRSASNETNCPDYMSKIRDEGPENGYSMIYWEQLCEMSDDEAVASLHKVVLGNDRLYILSKIWRYDPANRVWRNWRDYFEEVYVCDPNRSDHPCRPIPRPAGRGRP